MKNLNVFSYLFLASTLLLFACQDSELSVPEENIPTAKEEMALDLQQTLKAEQVTYPNVNKHVKKSLFGKELEMLALTDGTFAMGDMVFTDEYLNATNKAANKTVFDRRVRSWPSSTLIYWHASNLPQFMKNRIANAAREISNKTDLNVRFYRDGDPHYVHIRYAEDNGCSAQVGYLRDSSRSISSQRMTLGKNCSQGTVMHEFLHSAGIHHEQNHWNRDRYIQVWFQSIIDDKEFNYTKISDADGGEYRDVVDRNSIMMYGSLFWQTPQAKANNWMTMAWKEPNGGFSQIIPNRSALSSGDIAALNWWY